MARAVRLLSPTRVTESTVGTVRARCCTERQAASATVAIMGHAATMKSMALQPAKTSSAVHMEPVRYYMEPQAAFVIETTTGHAAKI